MPRTIAARSLPATTRERILDEAERLIAVKGVYGFTLRDIAVPLGVRVPAIYKHYKSRDDVLVEVARRFINLLSTQFEPRPWLAPVGALHAALDGLVELLMAHPAYVRLALVDFATPGGGMDYVNRAAGGFFKENFARGPLAAMHTRLRKVLRDGIQEGEFRPVDASDFYRLVKASILIRLAFPDDALLLRRPTSAEVRAAKRWLWDIAARHLARLHSNQIKAGRIARRPAPRPQPRLPKQ